MVYPKKWKCPNCKSLVKNNKICSNCGFKYSLHYPHLWSCPNCENLVSQSTTCKNCGYPNNLDYPKLWFCPECGNLVKSSNICEKCGYKGKTLITKKKKKETKLNKKINYNFNKLLDLKVVLTFSIGIIMLFIILISLTIPSSPNDLLKINNLTVGEEKSISFITMTNPDSTIFEFISPTGIVYTKQGEKNNNGNWDILDFNLNESGEWKVNIKLIKLGLTTEFSENITIKPSCENDEDCEKGICCSGSCKTVCKKNSDCFDDDKTTYDYDLCINAGTCEGHCYTPQSCDIHKKDGICPMSCSIETDLDCSNCPEEKMMCNGTCKKICENDYDCFDDDSLTYDKCHAFINSCDSYCSHTLYSEIGCKTGEIRVNDKCITPVCFSDNECMNKASSKELQTNIVTCKYPGTENAYCKKEFCPSNKLICENNGKKECITPTCSSNADCDSGKSNVYNICINPGKCNSECNSFCLKGYENFQGTCLKSCNSILDCANVYINEFEDIDLNLIVADSTLNDVIDENILIANLQDEGFTYYCSSNDVCLKYECTVNKNCNDDNYCTNDICNNKHCEFISVAEESLFNSNNIICCDNKEEKNYKDAESCDIPTLYYDTNNVTVNNEDKTISVNMLTSSDDCIEGTPFYITSYLGLNYGKIEIYYSSNKTINFTVNSRENQYYYLNGTLNCSKINNQKLIFNLSEEYNELHINWIKIYLNQGGPKININSNTCENTCEIKLSSEIADGVCPVGFTAYQDNDCKYCGENKIFDFENNICIEAKYRKEINCEGDNCELGTDELDSAICDSNCIYNRICYLQGDNLNINNDEIDDYTCYSDSSISGWTKI